MSLHSPVSSVATGDSPVVDDSVLEEDGKEECDHLSAALVTGQIAALRMLHVPFRCGLEGVGGKRCPEEIMHGLTQLLTPPFPHHMQ
jgi:hypothetical protein